MVLWGSVRLGGVIIPLGGGLGFLVEAVGILMGMYPSFGGKQASLWDK